MLKRVHIGSFRSCVNVNLDVSSPLMALAGRNGAGKTNVLKAVDWLARTATTLEPPTEPVRWTDQGTIEVSVDVLLAGKDYRYWLARTPTPPRESEPVELFREGLGEISEDSAQPPRWIFTRGGETLQVDGRSEPYLIGPSSTSLPALSALLPPEDPLRPLVSQLRDFLGSIRYYPLEEPMASGADSESLPLTSNELYQKWRAAPEVGESASVTMRLLHLFLEDQPRFQEVESLLGPNGLGVLRSLDFRSIDLATQTKTSEGKDLRFYFLQMVPADCDEDARFAFADLSAGTRRTIRLLVSLIYDGSNVMLLEQPEDSIHSGLTAKLLGILESYSRERVIIIATHSTRMFNALGPESIRLVTMRHGVTHVRPLSGNELETARAFLENEGSLSDFLEGIEED